MVVSSPLDRIQTMTDAEVDAGGLVTLWTDDVLALVNVAKAAEENVWMGEDPEVERGDLQRAWRQMGEALAALNKEPA